MRALICVVVLSIAGCSSRSGPGSSSCGDVEISGTDLGAALPVAMTGSTLDATDALSGASCGEGGRAADATFTWTAPRAGRYHIHTEGSDYDTILFVRSMTSDGAEIACNDDVQRGTLHSRLSLELDECQTIAITVDGYAPDSIGNFRLAIDGTETSCSDGIDDDDDGAVDCDDTDCFGPECRGSDDWPTEWTDLEWAMLEEVNRNRLAGAECDGEPFPPAPALEMNETVQLAARFHSQDMGAQNYFEHDSLDGREFSDRMVEQGFSGASPWGENIAAGYQTAEAATAGLMRSPGHCRNIMNPDYRVVGIGYAYDPDSEFGHYWTQDFAAGH